MDFTVPSMTFFGIPFGGGSGCRTTSPVQLSASIANSNVFSTDSGSLIYLQGGFTMPVLNNQCGFLGAMVSAQLAGSGNTLGLLLQNI
jgi:hypothetical protein